jgi:hypothetical protein
VRATPGHSVHGDRGPPLIRPAPLWVGQMDEAAVKVDPIPGQIEDCAHTRRGRYRQRDEKPDVGKLASVKESSTLGASQALVARRWPLRANDPRPVSDSGRCLGDSRLRR